MGYMDFFGLAAQTITSLPLPLACITTTAISYPSSISINNSTLTYTGPLVDGFFTPLALTTTTYTTVVASLGVLGTTELQTYTIIGAPVELSPSSPSPIPAEIVVSSSTVTSTSNLLIAVPTPTTPGSSTTSDLPETSAQPQGLSTYIPLNSFVGCLSDTSLKGQPLLYGPTAMKDTQESCKIFCTTSLGGPYRYFGMKSGRDCYCGNSFLHPIVDYPGECNMGCSANATQQCGGSLNRISVWTNSDWPLIRPPVPRPGSGQPEIRPPFGYSPSDPGDGVDGDPLFGQPYPGPPRPLMPPPGIDRPPSLSGDGVDVDSSEGGYHSKNQLEHHTKQQPKRPNSKPSPVRGPRPKVSNFYPTSVPPLDNDSYNL